MKKMLIILCLLMILAISGCKNKEEQPTKEKEPEISVNEVNLADQTVDGLKITGFNIIYENESSLIVAIVKNTKDNEYELRNIKVKLYDNDTLLLETSSYIGNKIEIGEYKLIQIRVTSDLRKANKVEYEVVKK